MTAPDQINPANPQAAQPAPALYLGLGLITMATLLLELGLTRIFSVIIYYHMAFFAVSVTLFGMALGGVVVHFLPGVFTVARARIWMSRMALAFAVSIAVALAVLLGVSLNIVQNKILAIQLCLISAALAVPFTCSGVVVAIALTRFPRRTNLLYGFDLAGAALGCLLFAPLITKLGGPGFVLGVATLTALAGVILAVGGGRVIFVAALAVTVLMGVLTARRDQIPIFQIRHLRGAYMPPEKLAFEGWNAISRVIAYPEIGHAEGVALPFYEQGRTPQYMMLIDTFAGTPIIQFDGKNFSSVYYPFHDISYAVHAVRKNASVAVIGVGGGRDILAAKAWGQPRVLGIDINTRILEALTQKFHDYAGRPLTWPGVRIVQDEARSHITRSPEPFDIIQASLIDTFAATAAGAFVLTENSLYTLEGWNVFLDRLTDRGILTMTRWYTEGKPVESIRLLALARAALESRGVKNPRSHILMARSVTPGNPAAQPLATILVKKTPFTPDEIHAFEAWIKDNRHALLVTPERTFAPELEGVMSAPDLTGYVKAYPFEISAPTDNRPFFFDVLRWRDILKKEYRQGSEYVIAINLKPLIMLGSLMATVIALAGAFIVVPLMVQARAMRREAGLSPARRMGMLIYFIMLGLGYILIELTLMQRFTVFLGHPGYSLTVCLFTMLLASGIGSALAPRIFGSGRLGRLNLTVFAILILTLAATLAVMRTWAAAPTFLRIMLAGGVIAPAAFFMGMPFPLAIQAASRHPGAPLAWFWGINGAFSVCASVLTVVLAHWIGLNGGFVVGALCYLTAALVSPAFRHRTPGEIEQSKPEAA